MKQSAYPWIKWSARLALSGAAAIAVFFLEVFRYFHWNLDDTVGALIFYLENDPLGVAKSFAIQSAALIVPLLAASAIIYLMLYKNLKLMKRRTYPAIKWGAGLTLVCGLVFSVYFLLENFADWPYRSLSSEPQPQVFHFPSDWPRL